jgi:glutamate carboxypeptidase
MLDRLMKYIKQREQDIYETLTQLVDTNSFYYNAEGLKKVGDIIMETGRKRGIQFEPVLKTDDRKGAFHLLFDETSDDKSRFYGILGHIDTVYPPDDASSCLREEGERLIGPGTLDMKGGIVVAVYALKAVKEMTGLDRLPVKAIFNCDEEIGSPDSSRLIEQELAGASGAFVFEGRNERNHALVTARKGIIMGHFEVMGRAAHAGEAPEEGINAVLEAAHKIVELSHMNGLGDGTTVNTGRVVGGTSANQVPDLCRVELDFRFKTPEAEALVRKKVAEIMAKELVQGTKTHYSLQTARPPFVRSDQSARLLSRYMEAASEFGSVLSECSSGAGSDGNLTAAMGVPTLDGLGPEGDGAHSPQEYIIKRSVMGSIKVFALFLSRLITTN